MVHPAYLYEVLLQCLAEAVASEHAAHCIADELLDNGIIVPYNMLFCIICFLFYHYYIISLSSLSTINKINVNAFLPTF